MVNDLIKKLRTCPTEKRKDIAMQLAKEGSEENISELINMVNGEIRLLYPETKTEHKEIEYPKWFGLMRGIKEIPHEVYPEVETYNYEDQIIGIEALGETCSKEVLNFLKELKEYNISSSCGQHQDSQASYYGSWENVDISFSNIKGPLKKKMNLSEHFEHPSESDEGTGRDILKEKIPHIKEYQLILNSISKVKERISLK